MSVEGKRVVVTGAAQGIGRGIVDRLAAEGAQRVRRRHRRSRRREDGGGDQGVGRLGRGDRR